MFIKLFAKPSEGGGGIRHQVLMTIMINIPLISFGLTMGWLSPNSILLQSSSGPADEPLTDETVSWMASVTFLAAIPAVFLYWYAVDILGRKPALISTSVPFVICWSLKLYSHEPWALITARAIAGLGSSGCFIVVPLYVKEISQDSIRGALGSVLVLAQNLGYLVVYIMSDLVGYRAVLWACFALPVAHIVMFAFLPESPSFLLAKGRVDEATKTLAWLRRRTAQDKMVLEEMAELKRQEIQARTSKAQSLRSIVSDSATFQAFRIALTVVLAQEVCGLFTLLMFAGRIFKTAGAVALTANQQVMVLGAVQLAGSVLASCFVERIGRKPLLASSAYVVSCCMLTLGVWFYLSSRGVQLPAWLPAAAMCLAIFCDSAGLQPVPFVIMSELFNFELRGMVATAVMGLTDLANFAELKVFHPIINSMGMHSCFWMFTAISFCFASYTVFCVPETMGKSVEEILDELRSRKIKKEVNVDSEKGSGIREINDFAELRKGRKIKKEDNVDSEKGADLKDINDFAELRKGRKIKKEDNVDSEKGADLKDINDFAELRKGRKIKNEDNVDSEKGSGVKEINDFAELREGRKSKKEDNVDSEKGVDLKDINDFEELRIGRKIQKEDNVYSEKGSGLKEINDFAELRKGRKSKKEDNSEKGADLKEINDFVELRKGRKIKKEDNVDSGKGSDLNEINDFEELRKGRKINKEDNVDSEKVADLKEINDFVEQGRKIKQKDNVDSDRGNKEINYVGNGMNNNDFVKDIDKTVDNIEMVVKCDDQFKEIKLNEQQENNNIII